MFPAFCLSVSAYAQTSDAERKYMELGNQYMSECIKKNDTNSKKCKDLDKQQKKAWKEKEKADKAKAKEEKKRIKEEEKVRKAEEKAAQKQNKGLKKLEIDSTFNRKK